MAGAVCCKAVDMVKTDPKRSTYRRPRGRVLRTIPAPLPRNRCPLPSVVIVSYVPEPGTTGIRAGSIVWPDVVYAPTAYPYWFTTKSWAWAPREAKTPMTKGKALSVMAPRISKLDRNVKLIGLLITLPFRRGATGLDSTLATNDPGGIGLHGVCDGRDKVSAGFRQRPVT